MEDKALLGRIDRALHLYDKRQIDDADRVLVHGDLGLHNIAVDSRSGEVTGIFDYEGAAWDDRHHDFRYLVFDAGGEDMLGAALQVYEPATGHVIDPRRVRLYNVICAIGFLADRDGVSAEQRSAGRTLEEDVRWTRSALYQIDAR